MALDVACFVSGGVNSEFGRHLRWNSAVQRRGLVLQYKTDLQRHDEQGPRPREGRLRKTHRTFKGTRTSRYIWICSSCTQKPQDVTIEPFLVQRAVGPRLAVPPRGSNACETPVFYCRSTLLVFAVTREPELTVFVQIFFRENQCLDVSHHNMLKHLMDTTVTGGSNRQWIYQTCTEFGYCTGHASNTHTCCTTYPLCVYSFFFFASTDQGCEGATCPFSERISFQSEMGLCPSVFGISQDSLPERIALTNTYYGGNDYTTQRVVFINGEMGPVAATAASEKP